MRYIFWLSVFAAVWLMSACENGAGTRAGVLSLVILSLLGAAVYLSAKKSPSVLAHRRERSGKKRLHKSVRYNKYKLSV